MKLNFSACLLIAALLGNFPAFSQTAQLDPTFSGDGKLIVELDAPSNHAEFIKSTPDGKIFFGGLVYGNDDDNDFGLGRLLPNGNFDSTFSNNGKLKFDLGSTYDWAYDAAVHSNGKMTIVGRTTVQDIFFGGILRLNNDGTPDTSFGTNGIVRTNYNNSSISKIGLDKDENLLVGGGQTIGGQSHIILSKYTYNGELDTTFGVGGSVSYFEFYSVGFKDMAIQSDGKILVFGWNKIQFSGIDKYLILRFLPDGTLDSSFGLNGVVSGFYQNGSDCDAHRIQIQDDHKIVVLGYSYVNSGTTWLARFEENGTLDNTFGNNGFALLNWSATVFKPCESMVIQSNGKILIAGLKNSFFFNTTDFFLARYNSDGSPDNTFGPDGTFTLSLSPGNVEEYISNIAIQPDNKILLVGVSNSKIGVVRLLSDINVGTLDFAQATLSPMVYPNPINSAATLQYTLSEPSMLSVQLYDVRGSLICTLLEPELQAKGEHSFPFLLPEKLPSGTYYLRLSNGKQQVSVQIVKT